MVSGLLTEPGAIYVGKVRHRRFAPRRHAFTYPVFMVLFDLDRVDELVRTSRLVSRNGFNWASFNDRDHIGDPARPLRERFRASAEAQGLTLPEGPLYLLTNLRYWGYGFNPVSYLYGFDREGTLKLIGAEVTNTPWHERHVYWMEPSGKGQAFAFDVAKALHVSPFFPMDLRYRWTFTQPGEALRVRMALFDRARQVFDADLELERRPWDAATLRRTLFRFPWMTLKVIAAIHWEALWIWIKRVPVFTHPRKAVRRAS